jgi:hypothetical protein
MNSKGWCPLVSHEFANDKVQNKCKEKECAWWNSEEGDCILFCINKHLQEIKDRGE